LIGEESPSGALLTALCLSSLLANDISDADKASGWSASDKMRVGGVHDVISRSLFLVIRLLGMDLKTKELLWPAGQSVDL